MNKDAAQGPGADQGDHYKYYQFGYSGPIDFYVAGGENNKFNSFFNGFVSNSTLFSSGNWADLKNATMSTADGHSNTISTYIRFTGSLTLNGTSILSVEHDDGVALKIDNSWQPAFTSGETADDIDKAIVAGGTHAAVELDYVEANGAPSILKVSQTPAVPEPASLLLFGSGLASIGGLIRRKIGK